MFEIGNSLRDARQRQGLELSQLEGDTKVRAKYLRALEEERFDMLPGESYARGFLQTYAASLGLDGQLYVEEFDSRFAHDKDRRAGVRRVPSARRLRFEASAVSFGLLGIVAAAVLVVAAWQFSGGASGEGAEPQVAADPTPAVEATAPVPSAPLAPVPAALEPPARVEPEPVMPAPAVEEAVVEIRATKPRVRVTVRRNGANGRVLFAGRLARDETMVFRGARIHVALREPAAVEVRVNAETLPSAPRRLVATADGWRRG